MAYGFRDGGSPLIDLIQSYRAEQVTRDKMRMDQLNMEQERRYRGERDAVADKRYAQEYADGKKQQEFSNGLAQNRESREAEDFEVKRTERLQKKEALGSYFNGLTGELDEQAANVVSKFDSVFGGGGGASGRTQSLRVVPDGDDLRLFGVTDDGTELPMNNADPRNNDPLQGARVLKKDAADLTLHVESAIDSAAKQGLSKNMQQAYARASVYQDPETGYMRPATPEEMAANLKNHKFVEEREVTLEQVPNETAPNGLTTRGVLSGLMDKGVLNSDGTGSAKAKEYVAERHQAASNKRIAEPRLAEMTASDEGMMDQEFLDRDTMFKDKKAIVAADKMLSSTFEQYKTADGKSPIKVKDDGHVIVPPDAKIDDLEAAKRNAENQGRAIAPPKGFEDAKATFQMTARLDDIASKKRGLQIAKQLFMTNQINAQQLRNFSETRNFDLSAAQAEKDAVDLSTSKLNLIKSATEISYTQAKIAELKVKAANGTDPALKGVNLFKTPEGQKLYSQLEKGVKASVGQYDLHPDVSKQVQAKVAAELPILMMTRYGDKDASEMGLHAALNIATGLMARDVERGIQLPMVTYLTDVNTKMRPTLAKVITDTATSRKGQMMESMSGQQVPVDEMNLTFGFNEFLEQMTQSVGDGEITDKDVNKLYRKFLEQQGL